MGTRLLMLFSHSCAVLDHMCQVHDHSCDVLDHMCQVHDHSCDVLDHVCQVHDHSCDVLDHMCQVHDHSCDVLDHVCQVYDRAARMGLGDCSSLYVMSEYRMEVGRPHLCMLAALLCTQLLLHVRDE